MKLQNKNKKNQIFSQSKFSEYSSFSFLFVKKGFSLFLKQELKIGQKKKIKIHLS